jgi:WD40 repeat protein
MSKKSTFQRITLSLFVVILAACSSRNATPSSQLEPTRTIAPRTPVPVSATPSVEKSSPAESTGAKPEPRALTGLTRDNIDRLAPLFTREDVLPSHIYSVAEDRLALFNSRVFEVVDSDTLELKRRTEIEMLKTDGVWYALSLDGKVGAIMRLDKQVEIYDLDAGKILKTFTLENAPSFDKSSDIALNADGTQLIALIEFELQTYDLGGEKLRAAGKSQTLDEKTVAVRFSEDGSRLAAILSDGNIVIYNTNGDKPIALKEKIDALQSINFSPTGEWFGASGQKQTIIWRLSKDAKIARDFPDLTSSVSTVFTTDGAYALLYSDIDAVLFNLKEDRSDGELRLSSQGRIASANFSPDGKKVFLAGSGLIESFSVPNGDRLAGNRRFAVTLMHFTQDGQKLIGWSDRIANGEIVVMNTKDGATTQSLLHDTPVRWTLPGKGNQFIASAALGQSLKVWRVEDGKSMMTFQRTNEPRGMLCLSPDEKAFAYLEGDSVIVREIDGDVVRKRFKMPFTPVTLSNCQNDKGWVAFAKENQIEVMNLDGKTVSSIESLKGITQTMQLELSKDSRSIAALVNKELTIWDAANGKKIQQTEMSKENAILLFSPSGQRVLVNYGDNVDIVDSNNGEVVSLDLPRRHIVEALFSNDDRIVVTASRIVDANEPTLRGQPNFVTGELTIWDATTGKVLRKIATDNPIYYATISEDGSMIATSTFDGKLTVWGIQ